MGGTIDMERKGCELIDHSWPWLTLGDHQVGSVDVGESDHRDFRYQCDIDTSSLQNVISLISLLLLNHFFFKECGIPYEPPNVNPIFFTECDIPYEPPSKFVLEILDPQRPSDMQRSPTQDALANEIIALSVSI